MNLIDRAVERSRLAYVMVDDGFVTSCTQYPGREVPGLSGQKLVVGEALAGQLSSLSGETTDPRIDGSYTWSDVRVLRDALLAATDFTVLQDSPFSPEIRDEWKAYRAALRSITDQPSPASAVWPTPPA